MEGIVRPIIFLFCHIPVSTRYIALCEVTVWRTFFIGGLLLFISSPVDLTVGHTGDRTGRPLPVRCHNRGCRSEVPPPATNHQTVENNWANLIRLNCLTSEACRVADAVTRRIQRLA